MNNFSLDVTANNVEPFGIMFWMKLQTSANVYKRSYRYYAVSADTVTQYPREIFDVRAMDSPSTMGKTRNRKKSRDRDTGREKRRRDRKEEELETYRVKEWKRGERENEKREREKYARGFPYSTIPWRAISCNRFPFSNESSGAQFAVASTSYAARSREAYRREMEIVREYVSTSSSPSLPLPKLQTANINVVLLYDGYFEITADADTYSQW